MSIFKEAKYLVYLNFNIIIAFYSSILLAFGIVLQIGEEKGIKTFSRLSIGAFSICVSILDLLIAGCGLWIFAKRKSSVLNYASYTCIR
ncbi:hypothetical protein BDFB_010055 [Asbolus verrucosus]|uniref:7tm 1 domain containing protein n=1 Tax=Asbolus verrucosus TaxID=1661398 RepID=A0A482VJ45_ASBVE|nr:hypothetical protein BDFB_010055 [Asbolus verrucosus]